MTPRILNMAQIALDSRPQGGQRQDRTVTTCSAGAIPPYGDMPGIVSRRETDGSMSRADT